MGDLLEGTMFEKDYDYDLKSTQNKDDDEAPGVVLKPHLRDTVCAPASAQNNDDNVFANNEGGHYEKNTKNDSAFKTSQVAYPDDKKANLVRLRNKEGGGSEESRRQKFYRRLSFSHKDKSKANLQHLRRSREAEEDFEIVNSSDLLLATTTTTTTTTATTATTTKTTSAAGVMPLHGSHTTSHQHNQGSSTPKTFAGLFTLNRRVSRRDTPKGNENNKKNTYNSKD